MSNASLPHILSRLRIALGTFIAVEAEAPDEVSAAQAIAAAFAAVSKVERLMHPTGAESDLARISACPKGKRVKIDVWTGQVLELCQRLHHSSGGIFDPCVPEAGGRLPDVDLWNDHELSVRRPVRIDLGGIAKGFAVDRAIDALRGAGCASGLVNAGGDLAVFGARSHRIVCRARRDGWPDGVFDLRNAALATSSVADESRPPEHRGHYHGRHGTPAGPCTVAVTAGSAAVADGLTKCLLFATPAEKHELLRLFGAGELITQNASPRPRSKRLKSALSSNH